MTMFSLSSRGGHNRYKFNKDFFKEWSPKMAYVLGYVYADGNITDSISSRAQYLYIDSKDLYIIEKIREVLGSEHRILIDRSRFIKHHNGIYKSADKFRLRIGSKEIFQDLSELGVTPKKSLTIKFPDNIPSDYLGHFLRGYFDGDGCVSIKRGKGKYGQPILKGIAVIFTSGSELFLRGLNDCAHKFFNLEGNNIYHGSNAYYLKYNTSESLKWFDIFYEDKQAGLFLKRKFNIFKKYFDLRPNRINDEIRSILVR